MLIFSVITLVAGVGFSVATFGLSLRALRRLVDMEFESHHEAWVHDGRPPGVVSTWGRAQFPSPIRFFLGTLTWPAILLAAFLQRRDDGA